MVFSSSLKIVPSPANAEEILSVILAKKIIEAS